MQTTPHIIANWKMYMRYADALAWCHTYHDELDTLSRRVHLGIAPEATAINAMRTELAYTNVHIGAQTCSQHEHGAYTGEISPDSLEDMVCHFCIVGHSEQRAYHNISSGCAARKADILLARNITPIVCVGETHEDKEQGDTADVLASQLSPVTHARSATVYIAYEPRWAIGSGNTPSNTDIEYAASHIHTYLREHAPHLSPIVLYGGSVSPDNSAQLSRIPYMCGFLVGRASCDFHSLQSIVYSIEENYT